MTNQPIQQSLVSTIIPVFNRPRMIVEAVDSVLAQTYRPIEVIVVDDGSTDETPIVVQQLEKKHREVRYLRKENSGPGPTREMGRLAAQGEFIQYLDSDDLLAPKKFEWMVDALNRNPDCGAAYGYIRVHPVGRPPLEKPFKGSGEVRETLFPWLLADRWWNTDCPLFRRSVCDVVGPWSDLRWSQDWEYDGRIGALGTKLVHIPEFVCDERHHTELRQTSHANWLAPDRLRSRLRFLEMLFASAEKAGVSEYSPQRQHFTRWVFATARQCAHAGLEAECDRAIALTIRSAGECREVLGGLGLFKSVRALLGNRNAGRLFSLVESIKKTKSKFTTKQSFARDLEK